MERFRMPRQSTLALGALAAGITLYELTCDREELITARVSENMETPIRKALTLSAIGLTSLHLAGYLPKKLDPYHYAGKLRRFTRP